MSSFTFDWSKTGFEERWFHALACMLARTCKQQDPSDTGPASELGDEEEDVSDSGTEDDDATSTPRNIARTVGKPKLLEKFLDRLSETLASKVGNDKADDVCAAAFRENYGTATIYVAKNRILSKEDKSMMRKLQVWLQSIANVGERRDFHTDIMWKTLLEWNVPRLHYYRNRLLLSFKALGVPTSTRDSSTDTKRIAKKLAFVQAFCEKTELAGLELDFENWTESITICYELRYESGFVSCIMSHYQPNDELYNNLLRLRQNVALLGRLRSA